jgi:hypothetical protein
MAAGAKKRNKTHGQPDGNQEIVAQEVHKAQKTVSFTVEAEFGSDEFEWPQFVKQWLLDYCGVSHRTPAGPSSPRLRTAGPSARRSSDAA